MITRCIVITITITTIAADALEPRFRCTGFHCWPNFIPPHPHIVLVNMGMVWCDGLYHFGYTVIWDACTHLAVKEIQVHLRSEIGEEWFSLMYNKFIFHSAIETINTISGMTTIQILFFLLKMKMCGGFKKLKISPLYHVTALRGTVTLPF